MRRLVVMLVASLAWLPARAGAQPASTPELDDGAPRRAIAPITPEPERSEPPPGHDPLRAAIENLAFLAGGTAWYLIDDRNVLDWDLESLEQRFDEASYRFDNNHFPMNFLAHPLSGAAFYGVPRSNGLSMPLSAIYGIVTSFLWEFVIEFKERFSINDSITTPIGGIAIGEVFHRLSRLLDEEAHPVLAWIFGTSVALHEAQDGPAVGRETPRVGPPSMWHDIRLAYGFGWATGDGFDFDLHDVSAEARFVAIPGHGRAGQRAGGFVDAEVASMRLDGFFSSTGTGFQLLADTTLMGVYVEDFRDAPDGSRSGGSVILGTSVSQLYRKERYDSWRDRIAFTGFPGLAIDAEERAGLLEVRFSGRLHGGFGGVHAPGLGQWQRDNAAAPKTILTNHGYYFGWGWSGRLELELRAHVVTVGGSLAYVSLGSQEGLARRQDLVVDDVHGHDELLELATWARVSGLPLGLFLEASFRAQIRDSSLGDVQMTRSIHRYQLALGFML